MTYAFLKLAFKIDFNLQGMSFIKLSSVLFRDPLLRSQAVGNEPSALRHDENHDPSQKLFQQSQSPHHHSSGSDYMHRV